MIVNCQPITFTSDKFDNPVPVCPVDFFSPNTNSGLVIPSISSIPNPKSNKKIWSKFGKIHCPDLTNFGKS